MTQEDKKLLLKDLCARLPYYPKCEMIDELRVVNNEKDSSYISTLFPKHIELLSYHNNFTIKPYLRPILSMTEEEKKEWHATFESVYNLVPGGDPDNEDDYDDNWHEEPGIESYDYFNTHHFDYRGLIPKGLAIEVTEENNPYK